MEITGKIVELLPEKSGESTNGTWRKQEYILETDSKFPKKMTNVPLNKERALRFP